jgi:hypothetical protein
MKYLLSFLFFLFSNLSAQVSDQTVFTLSPKGFITSWLIRGPFTSNEMDIREKDFLESDGGESKIFLMYDVNNNISEGKANTGKWFPIYSNKYIINLLDYFTISGRAVVYALCFIESERDQKVIIKAGSDDGIKIFLNGNLIHNNPSYRGVEIDEDVVNSEIKKGSNQLLVKIDQITGDWGFCLRITGENDEPLKDVKVKIPFIFSKEEILNSALSSLNINTTLDKTTQNTRLLILVSSENGFPVNFDIPLKLKLILLNSSSEIIEEFHSYEMESIGQFTEKEVSYIPKNLVPGKYVIRLVVTDNNNNELMTKENIVFWN